MSKILILIPAYNEARQLPKVLRGAQDALPGADLVVVDDGSSDETGAVALSLGAGLVTHGSNMGYGVAIQTGYKYALARNYDFLVQIDGDGQHDPDSIRELLDPLRSDEADFVIGSRFLAGGNYRPPLARRIGMQVFRRLVSWIVGTSLTDTTSGFQAFNRDVIRFFVGDVFPCDYPDADVLIILHRAGFRIAERPVRMFPNAEGKSMHSGFKPLYYIFKMFLSIGVTLLRSPELHRREKP